MLTSARLFYLNSLLFAPVRFSLPSLLRYPMLVSAQPCLPQSVLISSLFSPPRFCSCLLSLYTLLCPWLAPVRPCSFLSPFSSSLTYSHLSSTLLTSVRSHFVPVLPCSLLFASSFPTLLSSVLLCPIISFRLCSHPLVPVRPCVHC